MAAALELGEEAPESTVIEVWPPCLPYYDAFRRLHAGRQYGSAGMGGAFPLGLQYTEIAALAKDTGHTDPVEFEDFLHLVYAMDDEFMKYAASTKKGA